jgi:hypothetical protein
MPTLPAGVVRVFFAELARGPIGLVCFTGALVGERGSLQCTRGNRRVVVKKRNTHESFSGVLEPAALELNIASEKTRLSIHAAFGL